MKKKSLVVLLSLGMFIAGGGGGAWWWYMNQPEQISARAQQYLSEGKGEEAVELLTLLAEQGDVAAISQLAALYAEGKLVQRDDVAAARYLLQLAEQGNEAAQREMAKRYEQGCGVPASAESAARYFLQLAEHGDEAAQREMAKRYELGCGVPESAESAARWLMPFADKGETEAIHKICSFYMSGKLTDDTEAVKWYRAAADTMPEAKRALADCLATGKGVEKNLAEAAELYEQVITAEDAESQYTIAQCYAEIGKLDKMQYFTDRAAALGHVQAAAEIAVRHFDTGHYVKALPLLQLAAEAGNADAAARLSICCKYALGMKQDTAAAAKWAELAVKGGVNPDSLTKPTPTASQGVFDNSVTFTTLTDTSSLLSYQDAISKKNEENAENFEAVICDAGKTISSVQYQRSFDTFKGTCLIINDDFIATFKNDETIDLWDSRSLNYYFSVAKIRREASSLFDEYFQYDVKKGCFGYCFLPQYRQGIYDGMYCTAINFNALQIEYKDVDLGEHYTDGAYVKKRAKQAFSNPAFRHLNVMSDKCLHIDLNSSKKELLKYAILHDLKLPYDSQTKGLSINEIDFSQLKINRLGESQMIPEEEYSDGLSEPNFFELGLSTSVNWFYEGVRDDLTFIYPNWRDDSQQTDESIPRYAYSAKKNKLYRVGSIDMGYSGSSIDDLVVGSSDMAWYTSSIQCHVDRFYVDWVGDQVWDEANNRVYHISQGDAFIGKEGTEDFIRIPHYAGCNVLSIWNRLPGHGDKAYWIAVGDNGWSFSVISVDDNEVQEIAHGTSIWQKGQVPLWLPEHRWFCIPLNENMWQIYHFDMQKLTLNKLCSVCLHRGDEFAVMLPDGRYAGTPGCERFLYSMSGNKRVDMTALAPWRNRPADVLEALGGDADDIAVLRHTTERWLRKLGYDPADMPDEPVAEDLPSIQVARPALRTNKSIVTLPIKVKAAGAAVTKVEVRLDGVAIPQSWSDTLYIAPGTEIILQAELPLVSGQNWVDVTPVDTVGLQGNTERFRIISEAPQPAPKMYVVAMGVSKYQDSSLNLQYAAKDAGDIAEAFRRYYDGKTEVLLLRDAEVDGTEMPKKLTEFLAKAQPQDHVVMYCAGHGMLDDKLEYHYAPHTFNADNIAATGIAMDKLLDILESTPARNRLLLLDTCHSGTMGEEGEEKMELAMGKLPQGVRAIQHRGMKVKKADSSLNSAQKKRYIEELFATGTTRRGINVLAGASGAEFALESGEWNNGVFTAAVIESLSGAALADTNKDGHVDVAELYASVKNSVSERTGGAQQPTMSYLENNGEQKLVQNIGKYVLSKDWKTVENMCAQGYRLREQDVDTRTSWLASALEQGAPLSTIKALIKAGISLNCKVYNESSLLYEPLLLYVLKDEEVAANKEEVLRLMLENGATLGRDELMLDWSFMYKVSPDFIKFLIKQGADVNARDDRGKTPLMLADKPEIVRILLQHGADVTVVDAEGKTVLDKINDLSPSKQSAIRAVIREEKGDGYVSTILGNTTRVVAARLSMSAQEAYGLNDEEEKLRKALADNCAPVVKLLPKGSCTHAQLVKDIMVFFKRWPNRVYKVLGVARKDNVIEIKVNYVCKGDVDYSSDTPPRKVEGYALMTVHLNEKGQISALGEKTDKKAAPDFSPGMQEVPYDGPMAFKTL